MENYTSNEIPHGGNKSISSIEDYGSNNTPNDKKIHLTNDTDSNLNSWLNSDNTSNIKDTKYYEKIDEMVAEENNLISENDQKENNHNNNNKNNNSSMSNFNINSVGQKEKSGGENVFAKYNNTNDLDNNNNNLDEKHHENHETKYNVLNESIRSLKSNKSKASNAEKNLATGNFDNNNTISKENKGTSSSKAVTKCFICGCKCPEASFTFESCLHGFCSECFSIMLLVDVHYLNQIYQIHEIKQYKLICKCGKGHINFSSEQLVKFLDKIDNSKTPEEKVKTSQMLCVDCKNPAQVYCKECECFSCEECFSVAHPSRIKRLADHPKTKDFSSLNLSERKIKCARDGQEYCLFCNTCNYLLCNVCKGSHSSHKTEPVMNIFKKFEEKNFLIKNSFNSSVIVNHPNVNSNNNNGNTANNNSDVNNSIINNNTKNLNKSGFNNDNCLNYDEKQTKNVLEFKKNVVNSCEQIIKILKKLSVDFETAIDFELQEKSNINTIRKLISDKAENVTKSPNAIYFLKNLTFFTNNNLLKAVKSDLNFSVDHSILKTLEHIKGNIPYIYQSNCLLKYSYLNKINSVGDDLRNASVSYEKANYESMKNPGLKDTWVDSDTKENEREGKDSENSFLKMKKNSSCFIMNNSRNMLGRSSSNLDANPSGELVNNSITHNNNISKNVLNNNSNNNNSKLNEINQTAIPNPSNFKKTELIKIEEIRNNHINTLFMSEEQNLSKRQNTTTQNLVFKHSINGNIKSESERKVKSVLITNYFDKVLLVYSIANKFFLHDLEKDALYYQSEISDDSINNIFFNKIQGIPILILLGKKNCVFWDILTKQTIWKFVTDHFNFDRLLLVDLEFELLGANPSSPLNDEAKVYIESYFNNLDFGTYLQNLSVILWQSEYSSYFPFEYFYSDALFANRKRKLFGSVINNNNLNNSLAKENQQFGYVDKWVNIRGVLHIVCGSAGKITFYKYNNEIPESTVDKFDELLTNRKNYLLENMPVVFSISIEGFYTGILKYFLNNRNVFYFITYTGNLEKICIKEKLDKIPFMDLKFEKLKSNKYNGLFKIFEWSWEYCFLYGEKVLYVYSLVEDIVVKTLKTNHEILKLIRYQHPKLADSVGIVYVTGDVDILHV